MRNILVRIRIILSSAACLNVGNTTETLINSLCSNLVETANPNSTTVSPSQTPQGVFFSTSVQLRILISLILKHEEELLKAKGGGVKHSAMPSNSTQVLVFVKKQSTALVQSLDDIIT